MMVTPESLNDPYVDLCFRLTGSSVPLDHGYALYAALSAALSTVHQARWLGVHPLNGLPVGRELELSRTSRLRLRLPATKIADVIPLAGKRIEVNNQVLQLGVPEVHPLRPAAALGARLVNIKGFEEAEAFHQAALRQLTALGIRGQLSVGRRRVMRIKDKTIVGFQATVIGLTPEESITLQQHGLGGRRLMGCGLFIPVGMRSRAH
jgi:CRISPR-associated protein Cas6